MNKADDGKQGLSQATTPGGTNTKELLGFLQVCGLNKSELNFVARKLDEQTRLARISTAETALRACPTKDHMLRRWLEQHIESLERSA